MNKEEQLLLRRLSDLSSKASDNYYCTYSDFLNMNEQTLFFAHQDDILTSGFELYGGYPDAERRILQFYPCDFEKEEYPIVCLCIRPVNEKFSDALTHRDFLGAVLNLGIDRGRIGDILIENNTAYLFCLPQIADYIVQSLIKVKHTKVSVTLYHSCDITLSPHFKTKQGTVTSVRLDSIIAVAFNLSRTSAAKYIAAGSVFINGRLTDSVSAVPKDNDIISVRGLGRFKFENTLMKSKKDKFVVKAHVYI